MWSKAVNEKSYKSGDTYREHILEQYKIYVEMADRISARRNLANTFFLTLHTFILSAIGFSYEKLPILSNIYLLTLLLVAFLAFCYTWWRLVKSYRQLNTGKYEVIGEMEKRLPASPYYAAEWKALGEGKDPSLYKPLTHVENWIPLIFAAIYLAGYLLMVLPRFWPYLLK
ncbi:hypothetical protein JXB12_02105 [candidate division KSB1 bacterium]|nr:hypothetical protein [candidate division KSB1 bacterium]